MTNQKIKFFLLIGSIVTYCLSLVISKDRVIEGRLEKFNNVYHGQVFFIQKNSETYYVIPPEKPNLDEVCSYTIRPNKNFREYTIISVKC